MRLTPKPTHDRSGHRTYSRLTTGDTTTVAKSRLSRRGLACLRHRSLTSIVLVALLLVLSAATAHAEPTQVLALAGSIDQVLTNIRTWLMGILASLATVFLSIGGVRYVMGGGDPGEIEKAKTAFKSAAVGYGLAALAPVVVTVLQGIVGA
jgi:type IV secretory pathway VirB2 component (pilin)